MNPSVSADEGWIDPGRRHLAVSLEAIRNALARHSAGEPIEAPDRSDAPSGSALDRLCEGFALSPFERDVLLLAAGVELDSTFGDAVAAARRDPRRKEPTFGLAMAALPGAHWSALTPAAPLRRWRLIEVGSGEGLTTAPIRIDERVLHHLAGVTYLDDRLSGLVRVVEEDEILPPSQAAMARRVALLLGRADPAKGWPVVPLCGPDRAGTLAIAASACARAGLRLHAIDASDLPADPAEREALARLWEREVVLIKSALIVEADDVPAPLAGFLESVAGIVLIAGREPVRTRRRPSIRVDLGGPTAVERRDLWQMALGPAAGRLNGRLEGLLGQFHLGARAILDAGAEVIGTLDGNDPEVDPATAIWDACRARARVRIDGLAQRIESAARWEDLVLPHSQTQALRTIAAHVRRRSTVYEDWGFAARGGRGLGIGALFVGASGTGKTLAAEVLASELRLDLYRIDLSQVVSKYIGDTEKNLRAVFDAAEESGAILLFDEADALFGKRSEVKDSHDRYANIEVGYLLQRMETYRGLAILTTNLRGSLDTAFLRRLRFVVTFPFPDPSQRAEIWRRAFPPETPTEGLDPEKLGRLNVAGGNIRNIALNAAFLAADARVPVRMTHLATTARDEFAKLEVPINEAEIGGWV